MSNTKIQVDLRQQNCVNICVNICVAKLSHRPLQHVPSLLLGGASNLMLPMCKTSATETRVVKLATLGDWSLGRCHHVQDLRHLILRNANRLHGLCDECSRNEQQPAAANEQQSRKPMVWSAKDLHKSTGVCSSWFSHSFARVAQTELVLPRRAMQSSRFEGRMD